MVSKAQIKRIQALRLAKYREAEQLFVAEGVKVVDELLSSAFEVHSLYATSQWFESHQDRAALISSIAYEISETELSKISNLQTPNQVVAIGRMPSFMNAEYHPCDWVLMADKIRDPGNFGTMIRTADWFGFERVIADISTVDVWNPKVIQAAMGSVFRVPVHYTSLKEYLSSNAESLPVYGTLLEGESLHTIQFETRGIVVVGNESHGISDELLPYITRQITIPGATAGPAGRAESLNASIATSIICFEIKRQMSLLK